MQLELKFGVGDIAYTIKCCKIHQVKVKRIRIDLQPGGYRLVEYEYEGGPGGSGLAREEDMYPSKKELIANL